MRQADPREAEVRRARAGGSGAFHAQRSETAMPIVPIDDVLDPRIAVYRDLNRSNLTRLSGLFVAEGEKVSRRLLESRHGVVSLLAAEAFVDRMAPLVGPEVPVYRAPQPLLEEIVGFQFHRGVLACGRRRPNPPLAGIVPHGERPWTLVVCADVQDPDNLGGIIRNGGALGVDAVLVGPRCADPFSRRVLRISMGSVLHVPVVESADAAADLGRLRREHGVEVVGTVLEEGASPLETAPRGRRLALVFGNEGHGVPAECLKECDRRVTLAMDSRADSLNVAAATGVFLYHFMRLAGQAK
jgi:tRNA G18 (ribose-2'-O)-methylase SpoU